MAQGSVPFDCRGSICTEQIEKAPKSTILGSHIVDKNVRDIGCRFGDYFPDITLYRADGSEFRILDQINKDKPLLLVAGSHSCPVFRRNIEYVDDLKAKFGDFMDVYFVYTVEAHPDNVPSPYRDSIWIHTDNYNEKVFISQDSDFQGRVKTAKKMRKKLRIKSEILFDGPDNAYWEEVGQMPNFAYLLRHNGKVVEYQPWINHELLTANIFRTILLYMRPEIRLMKDHEKMIGVY